LVERASVTPQAAQSFDELDELDRDTKDVEPFMWKESAVELEPVRESEFRMASRVHAMPPRAAPPAGGWFAGNGQTPRTAQPLEAHAACAPRS
jgi:hypothetical protein